MDPSELSSRLIPLSDGRPGLRGTMHVEIHDPRGNETLVQSGKDAFHRVPNLVPGEASSTIRDNSCNSFAAHKADSPASESLAMVNDD